MFGQYLELSLHTTDIVRSIAWYEELGFTQLTVGEIWNHPYAVVSDGRLHIGLHAYAFESPALTFVRQDLSGELDDLKARGIRLAFQKTGDDEFNELGFRDPGGQMITVLEARTYSPPGFGRCRASRLGRFDCFALPAPDVNESAGFWQRLGLEPLAQPNADADFVAETTLHGEHSDHEPPMLEATLQSDDFALRLRAHPPPARLSVVFGGDDVAARIGALSAAGFELRPFGLKAGEPDAVMSSPEGLNLVLVQTA